MQLDAGKRTIHNCIYFTGGGEMIDEENSSFPVTEAAQENAARALAQIILARWEAAVAKEQTENKAG